MRFKFILQKLKNIIKKEKLDFNKLFAKITIGINSHCNRKCWFCPVKNMPDRNKGQIFYMQDSFFYSIIEQLEKLNFKGLVGFEFYNEPTLDKRLLRFLNYCKARKLRTYFFTNGDVMKKDSKLTKNLFDAVGYEITVGLYDCKDQQGYDKLKQWWLNYLNGLGIDLSKLKFAPPYWQFGTRAGLIDRRGILSHGQENDDKLPLKKMCRKAFDKINIAYNGKVPLCCEDAMIQYCIGSVREQSLKEIWFGEKRRYACEQLKKLNRAGLKPCNKCLC